MPNQPTEKDRSKSAAMPREKFTQELTDAELEAVTGGAARDASTGMASGKRQYTPIGVNAVPDSSTDG